jgi:hypothetical protein
MTTGALCTVISSPGTHSLHFYSYDRLDRKIIQPVAQVECASKDYLSELSCTTTVWLANIDDETRTIGT